MFFEFSLDWETQLSSLLGAYSIVVPTAVLQELRMLTTHQKKAVAALKLAKNYETIDTNGLSADDALLCIAEQTKGVVVTNDAELRHRLRQRGFPVVFLRGRKKLALDE